LAAGFLAVVDLAAAGAAGVADEGADDVADGAALAEGAGTDVEGATEVEAALPEGCWLG